VIAAPLTERGGQSELLEAQRRIEGGRTTITANESECRQGWGGRRLSACTAAIFHEVKLHSLLVAHLLLRVAMTHPARIAAQARCRTTPHSIAATVVAIKNVARFVSSA
jgi:hypothetical protein